MLLRYNVWVKVSTEKKCLLLTIDTNLLSGTVIGTEEIRTNNNFSSPAKMAR